MYAGIDDPYCYTGTTVLRNKLGLRDGEALEAFEEEISKQRASEPFPRVRLSVRHYCAIHHHLFQDVYSWAGRFRTVRIARGDSMFAYPEHVPAAMTSLFEGVRQPNRLEGLTQAGFAEKSAHILTEINAIHPFRDGNGRTQLIFLALFAREAGHAFNLDRLDPTAFLAAMIESFAGHERPLADQLRGLIGGEGPAP